MRDTILNRTAAAEPPGLPSSWMLRLWGLWFLVYIGGGMLAQARGGTGFFAVVLDDIEAAWIKLAFLNVPLHLVLAFVAVVARELGGLRISACASWLLTALIAVHVAISVAYA